MPVDVTLILGSGAAAVMLLLNLWALGVLGTPRETAAGTPPEGQAERLMVEALRPRAPDAAPRRGRAA